MKRTIYTSSWQPVKRALFSPDDPELGPVDGVELVDARKVMHRTKVELDVEDTEHARARLREMARRSAKSGGDPDVAEALIKFRNEL